MKRILLTVTNELVYDQRMIRICSSLADAGYRVKLIGRSFRNAPPLTQKPYQQKRIFCLFKSGKFFYLEYNFKLFFHLLFSKADAITAIDLDTIVPCLLVSKLKGCRRFYDAHELFTDMKEVISRSHIHQIWSWLERKTIPQFTEAYTVNQPIADIFFKRYGIRFDVIRNMAKHNPSLSGSTKREPILLYQGAVNEGRCFENLLPAMRNLDIKLVICGDGNYMQQAKSLINKYGIQNKVEILGKIAPDELRQITSSAKIGITLFEDSSENNRLSLANRFFDYIQAGTPQIAMNFPAYRDINDQHEVAVLLDKADEHSIIEAVNLLMHQESFWKKLHENCIQAATELSWQQEEKKLISFYQKHLG